jgi:tetratricopeptide (TPR) repeat protein
MVGLGLVAAAFALPRPAVAEPPAVPFSLVNGKLCARCTLVGEKAAIPATVVLDLGLRVPALLHDKTAKLVGLPASGIELKFDGVTLANLAAQSAELRELEDLSRDYGDQLGELPAVAIVGLPAFAAYVPQLDILAGRLNLLPLPEPGTSPSAVPPPDEATQSETDFVIAYASEGHSYWLPLVAPDDFRLRARFATSQHDTVIEATAADLAGAPAGDLASLHLGPLDLTDYVALRPEDLSGVPEPRPDVILGTHLLSHFRITIDAAGQRMRFERIREPSFPAEEQAYFRARAAEDADAIEKFLTEHRDSRLAREAGSLLLEHRLAAEPPDAAALARAMGLYAEAQRLDRRAAAMVAFADRMLTETRPDRYDLAAEALRVGEQSADKDLNARATYDIQARSGLIALRNGDLEKARRALLSAAFGLPRDPAVNIWLGEYYEKAGKPARAWSRFVQAALADEPPSGAFEGLDRLNNDAAFRQTFSMLDAEQLLEGRTVDFHTAERHAGPDAPPAQLVELFSCVDNPQTTAAELAFGVLAEYYAGTGVVLLQYHLANPAVDPLVSPAANQRAVFYGVRGTPALLVDGAMVSTNGGKDTDAPALFASYRDACQAVTPPAERLGLAGSLALEGDVVRGAMALSGELPAGAVLHLLWCEDLVMSPGANGLVLHRYIVRGSLTPVAGLALDGGKASIEYSLADLSEGIEKTLSAIEQANDITFLMRPTYIDRQLSRVAAIVQVPQTRQVLAAKFLELSPGARAAASRGSAPDSSFIIHPSAFSPCARTPHD